MLVGHELTVIWFTSQLVWRHANGRSKNVGSPESAAAVRGLVAAFFKASRARARNQTFPVHDRKGVRTEADGEDSNARIVTYLAIFSLDCPGGCYLDFGRAFLIGLFSGPFFEIEQQRGSNAITTNPPRNRRSRSSS